MDTMSKAPLLVKLSPAPIHLPTAPTSNFELLVLDGAPPLSHCSRMGEHTVKCFGVPPLRATVPDK